MFEAAMTLYWFRKISLENGKLVISLASESKLTLKQLLERINKDNLHAEVNTGLIIGGEIW